MPGIGETLREARMRQKIDIGDVEAATKIRAKYLRALENEEFDLLHGGTFVRSFLRTYAQYLGLDPQRLIEEYRTHHESQDEAESQQFARRQPIGREPQRRGPGPPGRGVVITGVVVVLLGFLLVLGLTGDENGGGGEDASPRATDTTARSERRERRERRARERPSRERRPAPRTVRVRVTPSEPVYLCWDRGAGTDPTELNPLERARTFRGRRIRINLGNPSAKLSVNGREVPLEGVGPFGFSFTPGKTDVLPAGERPCA